MIGEFRLVIVKHSDSLISEIDLLSEQILQFDWCDGKLEFFVNAKRSLFIDAIRQIESANLRNLDSLDKDELVQLRDLGAEFLNTKLFQKYCFLCNRSGENVKSLEKNVDSYKNINSLFGFLLISDFYPTKSQRFDLEVLFNLNNPVNKKLSRGYNHFFDVKCNDVSLSLNLKSEIKCNSHFCFTSKESS
jgi:hypothetical protein